MKCEESVAMSKRVDGWEVYLTDNRVSVGYLGGGCGSVVASKVYPSIFHASITYNLLNTADKVRNFVTYQ